MFKEIFNMKKFCTSHYNIIVVFLLILSVFTNCIAQKSQEQTKVIIHFTNWGIEQYWTQHLKIGDSFEKSVFDDFCSQNYHQDIWKLPSENQLLIPMPPNHLIDGLNEDQVKKYIEFRLKPKIEKNIKEGKINEFEMQAIENITDPRRKGLKGSYFDPIQQARVQRFNDAAYSALVDIVRDLERSGRTVAVDVIAQSNGGATLAKSASKLLPIVPNITKIWFVDTRAHLEPMRSLIKTIGAKKIGIFNTSGDYWANSPKMAKMWNAIIWSVLDSSPITMGYPVTVTKRYPVMHASGANTKTTEKLKTEFPEIDAYCVKPIINSHKSTNNPLSKNFGYRHVQIMENSSPTDTVRLKKLVIENGKPKYKTIEGVFTSEKIRNNLILKKESNYLILGRGSQKGIHQKEVKMIGNQHNDSKIPFEQKEITFQKRFDVYPNQYLSRGSPPPPPPPPFLKSVGMTKQPLISTPQIKYEKPIIQQFDRHDRHREIMKAEHTQKIPVMKQSYDNSFSRSLQVRQPQYNPKGVWFNFENTPIYRIDDSDSELP